MIIELTRDERWIGALEDFFNTTELYLSKEEIDGLRLLDVGEVITLSSFMGGSYTITRVE